MRGVAAMGTSESSEVKASGMRVSCGKARSLAAAARGDHPAQAGNAVR